MKCFYHNDSDGWCSAFWVRKYCEREGIPFTKEDFIEMNYDREFPMEVIQFGEPVYIVDFSIGPNQMNSLHDITSAIIWIDHHKTAIDKYNNYTRNISGIRMDGIAGCALTWWYLISGCEIYGDFEFKNEEIIQAINKRAPLFTQYIHLWDTWKWKNHPDASKIEAFITSLSCGDHVPWCDVWDILENETSERGIEYFNYKINEGMACLHFRDGYAEGLCKGISKVIEFEGFRCCVCNMGHVSSEWFKSIDPSIYDIMMPFYYNMQSGLFCFSLYSSNPNIDVSKIAVKWGGGGHFSAAGFQSRNLPF